MNPQTLADVAAGLGPPACTTADDVAGVLRKAAVTGRPRMACMCPLAVYALRVTEKPWGAVGVSGGRLRALDGSESVPLPKPALDFVDAFDVGYYPDLRVSR